MDYAQTLRQVTRLPGKAVMLEPMTPAATDEVIEAVAESDAALREYMPWSRKPEDLAAFVADCPGRAATGAGLECAIRSRSDGRFIGVIAAMGLNRFTPRADLGYWMRTSETGKGFATDAVSTLVAFCRDELQLVRLDACVATTNIASQKVLQKNGFEQEGLKRKAELCHGVWHDLILFGRVFE